MTYGTWSDEERFVMAHKILPGGETYYCDERIDEIIAESAPAKETAQLDYFVNRIIEVISNLEEDDEANDFVDLYCISLNNAGEECDEEDRIDTDELRKQVNEIDQRINL